MKKIILFSAISLAVVFVSCKKDSNNTVPPNTNALSGSWTFTSLTAHTDATEEENDGTDDIKTETTSDYTTTDNSGSITFANGTATATNIAYSVSSPLYATTSDNGVLVEKDTVPFTFSVPAASSTSTYTVIGSDSVFFTNGFVSSTDPTTGSTQPAAPIGYKFQIAGNILTMTTAVLKDSAANSGGIATQLHESATISVKLTKQ